MHLQDNKLGQQDNTLGQQNREMNGVATTDVDSFVFYITLDHKTVQKGKTLSVHGKIASFSPFFVIFTWKLKKNI